MHASPARQAGPTGSETMSIGLLSNIGGSVAGTSLAQLRGSDADRAQQEHSAANSRPKATRRPNWHPASARPTATNIKRPSATRTAGKFGSFAAARQPRSRKRRAARRRTASKTPPAKAATCSICPGDCVLPPRDDAPRRHVGSDAPRPRFVPAELGNEVFLVFFEKPRTIESSTTNLIGSPL